MFGTPLPADSGIFVTSTNDENQPRSAEKQGSVKYNTSSLGILQEISNSSRRRHKPSRATVRGIFPESTIFTDAVQDLEDSPSRRSDGSDTTLTMIKLRNGSLSDRTGTVLNSPVPKQLKNRKKSRTSLRSSSFHATEYIEALESELASVNAKLEAISSQSTSKSQAAKIRALSKQLKALRDEVVDWESKFEDRVGDEVFQRTQFENGLRKRLKSLEDAIEEKDVHIRELECDLEVARTKLKETEELEVALNRRVDVLTELLAQSPTRLDFPSNTSTPSNTEESKPTRPRSWVIPRLPTSPAVGKQSYFPLQNASEWKEHGRRPSESISEDREEVHSPLDYEAYPDLVNDHSESALSQSLSGHGTLVNSAPSTSSRPTSLISVSSHGMSWGLPLPPDDSKSCGKPRKMRRFAPGSTSLKPLILPTSAAIPQSLPVSAPVESVYQSPFKHSSSNSLDPTTAFSSRIPSSPTETPTRPFRRRSVQHPQSFNMESENNKMSWVSNQKELENSDILGIDMESPQTHSADSLTLTRVPTLHAELENAQRKAPDMDKHALLDWTEDEGLSTIRAMRITPPRPNLDSIILEESPSPRLPVLEQRHHSQTTHSSPIPLRRIRSYQQLRGVHDPTFITIPISAHGIFSRISEFLVSLKQRPKAIAKRIVVNAWSRGSSRFGGLGWWLIGLIMGPKNQGNSASHDSALATHNDAKWHQFSDPTYVPQYSEDSYLDHVQERYQLQTPPTKVESTDPASVQYRSMHTPSMNGRYGTTQCVGPHESRRRTNTCSNCVEPPSKRSLKLWAQFALTMVLAVGVAIIEGPGALLCDDDDIHHQHHTSRPCASSHGSMQLEADRANSQYHDNEEQNLLRNDSAAITNDDMDWDINRPINGPTSNFASDSWV